MNYTTTQKFEAPSFALQSGSAPKRPFNFKRVITAIYSAVAIAAVVNLVGTNALATQGIVLDETMTQIQKLEKENNFLRLEIAKVSNLAYIEAKAGELGFIRSAISLIIPEDQAVAEAVSR